MNETDRELLIWAAKAAGIEFLHLDGKGGLVSTEFGEVINWNPLTDNGDAFSLAIKLGLIVTSHHHVEHRGLGIIVFTELKDSEDFCTITRRAIVRAAAAIGRNMI